LYLDGVLVHQTDVADAPFTYSAESLLIGTAMRGAAGENQEWFGALDDLRIYNRAMSPTEVAALYAADAPNNWRQTHFGSTSTSRTAAAQNAELTPKLTNVMPVPSGNTSVSASGIKEKSLKLSPGWDTDLQKGKISTSEFRHVLSLGRCTADVDLSADDTAVLYPGIHYLDPASKIREYLQSKLKAKPISSRREINAAGFPARSIFSYDYSGDFEGFGHFILVVDAADQVVGVQLLQNIPKSLMLNSHSNHWSVYNFLQSRKKGTKSYAIDYEVSSGVNTFQIKSELIDSKRKSREWVMLILAKKFANLAMHVITESN
jgi:hypothetical protein